MSSLKDALMKAGYKAKQQENERVKVEAIKDKEVKQAVKHQEKRNFCEKCEGTYPDVEKFEHRNYSIDAKWMCVNCADIAQIHDDCRVTNQSDFAIQKKYIRRYGPTKRFDQVQGRGQGYSQGHGQNQNHRTQRDQRNQNYPQSNNQNVSSKPQVRKNFNDDDDDSRFNK